MDIEGSELDVLYGAKDIILKDKTKLAISIYHKTDTSGELSFIYSIHPVYKFYVLNHHDTWNDTVLYYI